MITGALLNQVAKTFTNGYQTGSVRGPVKFLRFGSFDDGGIEKSEYLFGQWVTRWSVPERPHFGDFWFREEEIPKLLAVARKWWTSLGVSSTPQLADGVRAGLAVSRNWNVLDHVFEFALPSNMLIDAVWGKSAPQNLFGTGLYGDDRRNNQPKLPGGCIQYVLDLRAEHRALIKGPFAPDGGPLVFH